MFQENLLCGDAFRDLGNLGRQHHRHRLDQEVHVVLIGTDLDKVQVVGWRKVLADFLERFFHGRGKHLPAILCRTDEVVQHAVYIVSFSYMFGHAFSIPSLGPREHPGAELRGNLFDYNMGEDDGIIKGS